MKKLATLALTAIIALSANAKKVETSSFTTVKVNAPVHIIIAKGNRFSVDVVSRNPELSSAISWKVKDGVLRLSARDLDSLEQSHGTVNVIVTAPCDVDYQIGKDLKQMPNRRGRR